MQSRLPDPKGWFVVVAFGSNVGDKQRNITTALQQVSRIVQIDSISGLYETEPMYQTDQPVFLNGVLSGTTTLDPGLLLDGLKQIERGVGRQSRDRNGPREIDLDIICHQAGSGAASLVLPHPRASERRFVLEPLNEIAPELLIEGYGVVRDLLAASAVQSQKVRRVADAPILV